ncbi:MAG: glycosyltransferase [Microgenomates group bacterium]|nr:glycosyltransferase [Microgenomates group bacterium]
MKISLIVPCYNEELNLQKGTLDKIGNYTKDDQRFLEVLIVDDGSVDKTKKIIKKKYLPLFSKFKLIETSHQGKASAVITGIKEAKGEFIVFSDFDLATPIEEIEKLVKQAENYSIVIGSRNSQREGAPLVRKIMARGFIFIRNFLVGLGKIKDTQCGFKLFERKSALKIIKKLIVFNQKRKIKDSSVSAGFDLEFLFVAQKFGFKIKEVPVIWHHVETKNVNFLKDSFEALIDIIKIKLADIQGKYK